MQSVMDWPRITNQIYRNVRRTQKRSSVYCVNSEILNFQDFAKWLVQKTINVNWLDQPHGFKNVINYLLMQLRSSVFLMRLVRQTYLDRCKVDRLEDDFQKLRECLRLFENREFYCRRIRKLFDKRKRRQISAAITSTARSWHRFRKWITLVKRYKGLFTHLHGL